MEEPSYSKIGKDNQNEISNVQTINDNNFLSMEGKCKLDELLNPHFKNFNKEKS